MGDVNLYTRLPEDLVTELDMACAKLRIKRPEAIRRAVEKYLRTEVGESPERSRSHSGANSMNGQKKGFGPTPAGLAQAVKHLRRAEALLEGSVSESEGAEDRGRKHTGGITA